MSEVLVDMATVNIVPHCLLPMLGIGVGRGTDITAEARLAFMQT